MVRNQTDRPVQRKPFLGRSRTKQADREAADVNAIVRKYRATGYVDQLQRRDPIFGDFSQVGDFFDAMRRVRQAEDDFAALPSEVRARCANDPLEFIRFMVNPANKDELREMGLEALAVRLHGEFPPPPDRTPPAPDPAPSEPA